MPHIEIHHGSDSAEVLLWLPRKAPRCFSLNDIAGILLGWCDVPDSCYRFRRLPCGEQHPANDPSKFSASFGAPHAEEEKQTCGVSS